ncbi:MAG: hypothetical protein AAGB27_05675 [Pseudomonadota bacterium]
MKVSAQELSRLISRQDADPPSPEELAALVDQNLPPERREALLNHLERSADSARAVAIALEPDATPVGGSSFRWLAVAASAAAAVALTTTLWLGNPPADDTLRAADPALTPAPGTLVTSPEQLFSWPLPPDLSPRRVRIMSAEAETIWLSEPTSPPVDLPAATVVSGKTYLWQLEDVDGTVVAGPNWFEIP